MSEGFAPASTLETAVDDPMVGRQLGPNTVLAKMASGGMAEIFLATQKGSLGVSRLVVVKRILPSLAESEQFRSMFYDEARIAAQLEHPNIIRVEDFGEDPSDGSLYMVMEYVEGVPLLDSLKRAAKAKQPVDVRWAATVVAQAAEGLHHAHELTRADGSESSLGLVHRDVSPHNILVTPNGIVKVFDFGIAKAMDRVTQTAAGVIKGKFAYMSPEQCRGRPIDRRSDIFSLGIVLYEMTTGRRLFRGATDKDVVRQIVLGKPPAPSRLVPDYPPALEHIVLRALARERDERYASAEELQLALEDFALQARLSVSQVGVARLMEQLYPAQRALPAMLDVATDEEQVEPTTEVADDAQPQGQEDDELDTDVEMIAVAESGPIQLTLAPAPSDERPQAPPALPPASAASTAPGPDDAASPGLAPREPPITLRPAAALDAIDRTARVASLQQPEPARLPATSWVWLGACVLLAVFGVVVVWVVFYFSR